MKIFIIEDDIVFSALMARKLRLAGYEQVWEFEFVSDALNRIHENPDIIIMDHFLNGLNGVDFIQNFTGRLPEVRIFYVTSQKRIEIVAQSKLLGAERYFKKDADVFENITEAIAAKQREKTVEVGSLFQNLKRKLRRNVEPTVFLLDEDRLFASFIRHKISKFACLNVKTFTSKEKLLQAAKSKPELLILDYHIGETTGNVVLQEFRAISEKTKVVMFSSQRNINTALDLFSMGIVDYVVKNNSWEVSLRAVLKKQLELTIKE